MISMLNIAIYAYLSICIHGLKNNMQSNKEGKTKFPLNIAFYIFA